MSTATIAAPPAPAPGPPSPARLKKQPPAAADFGTMLKAWRRTRNVSQLDLSSASGVSTRHLSFMETGRAKPSRDMVLRLADELEVPLRDRNKLLVAAGYAPEFKARSLGSPEMASVRRAIDVVLTGHLPYPALMHDQRSNIIEANKSVGIFTDLVAPHLLADGGNTVRLTLHPEGLAPHLVNHGEARDRLLRALSRRAAASGDPELTALLRECVAYPHPDPEPEPDLYAGVVLPFRIRRDGQVLSFFTCTAVFGSASDLMLADMQLETFFPADEATGEALREYAARG